jgi:MFS transporter, ACS family, hexuronate transporter
MRSPAWKWVICGLFLLASAINYMDRQTLANAAVRITRQFSLSEEQYGNLELVFGWAFAVGSIIFGIIVDRWAVRWVYPAALLLWSAAGFFTGFVESYQGLLICRGLLGLFEAGHWPCAIKAIQSLLAPKDRSMGNSVLQSGTSIGAVVTPLIMAGLLTSRLESWRSAFQVLGAAGLLWIVLWFVLVRKDDLRTSAENPATGWFGGMGALLASRKMWLIIMVVALINTNWQILRAWLPKFLIQGRGYGETEALYFNSLFYIATDVGCLGAGALTLWLHRKRMSVGASRNGAFLICALLSALTVVAVSLPKGPALLAVLLLAGAGALGVFPIYHAVTQDVSKQHQGKVTGIAGVAAWALSPAHKFFGRLVDQTGSFNLGFAVMGCLPLVAFFILWLFWEEKSNAAQTGSVQSPKPI